MIVPMKRISNYMYQTDCCQVHPRLTALLIFFEFESAPLFIYIYIYIEIYVPYEFKNV